MNLGTHSNQEQGEEARSICDTEIAGGQKVRSQLADEVGEEEFCELISAFAEDLRCRFSRSEVAGLEADACQVASVADALGFPALRIAAQRLKVACASGENICDAIANIAVVQRDVIRTIAGELGGSATSEAAASGE